MSQESQAFDSIDRRRGLMRLISICAATVFIWCVVLPWYAERPGMKQHLKFLNDRGIDPSAMFYTELDYMDSILKDK